ncbi:MAG: bifunctional DNA primase/polymerase [Xanthobacteraceae bacterium]
MEQSHQAALDSALRLAAYGRPSFPCAASKKPTCLNGYKDATADETALRDLWQQYPGPLVGVPTGSPSGLFVVDVDCGRHPEAQDWLERVSPNLPETRTHATRSGGWHLLFKHRAGLRNSAGKLAKGVDTRGDGGYVIWWPFHTGLGALHRLDLDAAELPDWIQQQLVDQPRIATPRSPMSSIGSASGKVRGLLNFIANANEGQRNASLFWCANRLREMATWGELSQSQFNNACSDLAQAGASIGLPRQEAERTIVSAMRARS